MTQERPKPSPRLHVIFARRKPRAVILRRGPSNWYHVIAWNTARDTFEHGSWFKGRIYEERCDLSPDGELLLYFALQGRTWNTPYRGAWTAISRSPWLHALTLWPHGCTWGGGGCFDGDRSVILQGSSDAHPDHPVQGIEVVDGRCNRIANAPDIPEARWSGYDQGGNPVFASEGKLFRRLDGGDRLLADFNGLTPDPRPAPDWARTPLPPPGKAFASKRRRRQRRKQR